MVFNQQSSLFVDWNSWGGNTKLLPSVIHTYSHSTASIAQGRPQILGSDMACPPALGAASQPKARRSLASEGHCWDLTSTRRACGSVIDVFMVFIPLWCSQQNQVQVITTHRTWTLCLYYQASYQRILKCKVGIQYWSKYSSMSCTNPAFFNHHPQQRDDL